MDLQRLFAKPTAQAGRRADVADVVQRRRVVRSDPDSRVRRGRFWARIRGAESDRLQWDGHRAPVGPAGGDAGGVSGRHG